MQRLTREARDALTPGEARELLEAGNARFREGRCERRDLLAQVHATRAGQWPFAAVLGCIDSRTPAELIFDCGIGDVFNVRVAGNVVNDDVLGSLEFACVAAGAKLVVVLGHTGCGAVEGACDGVELGHLTALLGKIRPALDRVAEPSDAAERRSANATFVTAVARANVERTIVDLTRRSEVLHDLRAAGAIEIAGAMYDVASGAAEFLGHPTD